MDQRKNLALAALKNAKLLEEVGYLGNLAGALTDISESLELIRPFQTIQSVAWLPETIRKARPALARTAQARPFAMVLEEVARAYQPLAQDQPESADTIQATLEKERTLISWYASRQHWVPAVSLAREWLLSWIMYKLGMIDLTQHEGRLRIENVVGAEANDFRTSKKAKADFHTIFLTPIPTLDAVLELWLELADVRNDIDHAGMREMPGKPKDLIKRINKCIKAIDQLPI